MTRIERDSEAIKMILFSSDYDKIIKEMLDPVEALNLETAITESLHKFYSNMGVNYYDEVNVNPKDLVTECATNVINKVKKDKSEIIESATNIIKKLGFKLKSDFTAVEIDSIINIELVKEALEYMFGDSKYVKPILKEYVGLIVKKLNK